MNKTDGNNCKSCDSTSLITCEESDTSVLLSFSPEEIYQFNLEAKKMPNTENNSTRQLSVIPQNNNLKLESGIKKIVIKSTTGIHKRDTLV